MYDRMHDRASGPALGGGWLQQRLDTVPGACLRDRGRSRGSLCGCLACMPVRGGGGRDCRG